MKMKCKELSVVYPYGQTTVAAFTPTQCLDWKRETSKKGREKEDGHMCAYSVYILKYTTLEMDPNQMTPVF